MTLAIAEILVLVLQVYLAAGVVFAVPFVHTGAGHIDPAARNAGWGFRLLIFPGSVALWPMLAWRWIRGGGVPPTERNAHRDAATATTGQ